MIIPLLISCGQDEESNRQVDQNYLDSQEYSEFNEDAASENEMKTNQNASMQERLTRFAECEPGEQMEIPFMVDDQQILDATERESTAENCIVENGQQSLKLVGESRFQNQTVRWVVLERQTAYRDQELFATIFRGDNLQSFNSVGVFKENPTEEIQTEIEVRNKGNALLVTSRTTRNIFYPIEQENTVTTEYQIYTNGSIQEL